MPVPRRLSRAVSPFLFRLGPLAFARHGDEKGIGGWRRLWWRFWWKVREVLPEAVVLVSRPYRPPAILHYTAGDGLPLCGASSREAWTIELEAVTCVTCRTAGWPMRLQYDVSTR